MTEYAARRGEETLTFRAEGERVVSLPPELARHRAAHLNALLRNLLVAKFPRCVTEIPNWFTGANVAQPLPIAEARADAALCGPGAALWDAIPDTRTSRQGW